ncbi:MAG: ribonuclease HIII, partial [Verrucomicrobiales bacterium]
MPLSSYTAALTPGQAETLRAVLEAQNFEFKPKPYTLFAASRGKLNISVYEKGPKVLVQGRETEDFVRFHLEPEVLGEARLGYEEVHNPEFFEPHIGIDESGKGDFFGPLVVAGVYVDAEAVREITGAGVRDSKRITSDVKIRALADAIRNTRSVFSDVIVLRPEKYNELYEKFANLNRLLAWGHARVLENILERVPDCP